MTQPCAVPPTAGAHWLRRARPLLGTLVEVGVPAGAQAEAAVHAAFGAIAQVQRLMSVFEADSDLGRSHAAAPGEAVRLHPWTAQVLRLARWWFGASGGRFDVAQGSGAWRLDGDGDGEHGADRISLVRLDVATRLDLGGLAKGWAVDQAVDAALAQGVTAVWVNAGGDLRVQGLSLPVCLREEDGGGVRPWLELADGALATSDLRPHARARLSGGPAHHGRLSVAAPRCATADALTKILAQCADLDGDLARGLLAGHGAQVWTHDPR